MYVLYSLSMLNPAWKFPMPDTWNLWSFFMNTEMDDKLKGEKQNLNQATLKLLWWPVRDQHLTKHLTLVFSLSLA